MEERGGGEERGGEERSSFCLPSVDKSDCLLFKVGHCVLRPNTLDCLTFLQIIGLDFSLFVIPPISFFRLSLTDALIFQTSITRSY